MANRGILDAVVVSVAVAVVVGVVVDVVVASVVADFAELPGAPPGSPQVRACHPDSSTSLFSCDDGLLPLSERHLK